MQLAAISHVSPAHVGDELRELRRRVAQLEQVEYARERREESLMRQRHIRNCYLLDETGTFIVDALLVWWILTASR